MASREEHPFVPDQEVSSVQRGPVAKKPLGSQLSAIDEPPFTPRESNLATPLSNPPANSPTAPSPPLRTSGVIWLAVFSMLIVIVVVIGPRVVEEYAYAYARGQSRAEYDVAKVALESPQSNGMTPLTGLSTLYEFVAQKISPSVVHIETTSSRFKKENLLYVRETKGQGSGVIYTTDGYIITNQHVVVGAKEIRVTLHDRTVYQARVIGTDERTDLAVLKIDASGLIPGEWSRDSDVRVGTLAWAVGSPFGLDQSITCGIVSGRHRRVKPQHASNADYVFKDLIQTDAAINPGNSGGPLVNSEGNIMGINSSIIGGSYQGVCFAVPTEIVQHVADEIIAVGYVKRGYLGVIPEIVSYEYAREQGLTDCSGALVKRIMPETPAAEAGIQRGDVIRKWNDRIVESELTLFNLVANADADTTVELEICRAGVEMKKSVRIASRDQLLDELSQPPKPDPRPSRNSFGFGNPFDFGN